MACYKPLDAVDYGTDPETGKRKIRVISSDRTVFFPSDKLLKLPCGQCIGCRIDYSKQWANRCMLENQYHDSSYFVTLTYDDEHVPLNIWYDGDDKEVRSQSLDKRHFQLFMKRLRKAYPDDHIRYFMCGEYGGQTFRPHYHAILYGLHLDDLQYYKRSPQGFAYYNSPKLQSIWSDRDGVPYGYVVVADVTWETCAYVARYIMKKQKGAGTSVYEELKIEPEFTLMSRKPGIARQYFEEHSEVYDFDEINLSTPKGGLKFKPPRYFDKLFEEVDKERFEEVKAMRALRGQNRSDMVQRGTSVSPDRYCDIELENFSAKIKSLRRNMI